MAFLTRRKGIKIQKGIFKTVCAILLAMNMMIIPIIAADEVVTCSEPRFNNISAATLTMGFDMSNVGYFGISVTPYSKCTGFDGIMRLFDSNGNQLKSWSVYDHESPYGVENTYQCEYGKTYTVTFQGYAYGTNSMYDEINLSNTGTCKD